MSQGTAKCEPPARHRSRAPACLPGVLRDEQRKEKGKLVRDGGQAQRNNTVCRQTRELGRGGDSPSPPPVVRQTLLSMHSRVHAHTHTQRYTHTETRILDAKGLRITALGVLHLSREFFKPFLFFFLIFFPPSHAAKTPVEKAACVL